LGNFLIGFALYASAYLLPQYLAVTQGFDAEQSGAVMAWTGLPQLFVIPLVPLLMKRIDARLLVATGLVIFASSCFMNLELDQNYAAPQLFWPDIVRALGQAIVMTPISAIAMVGIAPNEAGAASGLFNMMRNLGGAIGTAAIETFFTKREQFHSAIITPEVSLLEPATRSINECEGVSGLHLVEERGLDGNCRLLHVDLMDARHQPHTGEFGHMSDCVAGRPPLDDGRSGCNRTGAELRTGEVKRN
jgi:hypothetical protein